MRRTKRDILRMTCDLDVNLDLTIYIFFVKKIDDEIEIVVGKIVNQSEKE